jgi:sugar phosphate isomerase/epimerase
MKELLICDASTVDTIAPIARDLGAGIEIQAFYQPAVLDDPAEIPRHQAAVEGIERRSMHGPFSGLCPGCWDPRIQAVTRDRVREALAVAAELQTQHLILHHGFAPHTISPGAWVERSAAFWKTILADIPDGLRIHVENVLDLGPSPLQDLIHAVDHPAFDINLDIGHCHALSTTDPVAWIETLGSMIGYTHLHNNDGTSDSHQGFSEGTADMRAICEALQRHAPDATWAVEVFGEGLRPSLDWLHENSFVPPS